LKTRSRIIKLFIPLLLLAILILPLTLASGTARTPLYYFYIYGENTCPHCIAMHEFLIKTYGEEHVIFCNILPETKSNPCFEKLEDFSNTGLVLGVPFIIVVYNNTASAIVIGEYENKTFFDSLLHTNPSDKIPVYTGGVIIGYINASRLGQHGFVAYYAPYHPSGTPSACPVTILPSNASIEWSPTGTAGRAATIGLPELLGLMVFLALLDSVNPCTLTIYGLFLVGELSMKKRVAGPGLLFIAVIYVGYLVIGLGLFYLSMYIPQKILGLLAIILGAYNILDIIRGGEEYKCRVCDKLSGIGKAMGNPYVMALVLSLISVTVLLPCTSGPLVAFIAVLKTSIPRLAYLLLPIYVAIFSLPLIIMYIILGILGRRGLIEKIPARLLRSIQFITSLIIIMIGASLL